MSTSTTEFTGMDGPLARSEHAEPTTKIPENSFAIESHAQDILVALVKFMRPIINEQVSFPTENQYHAGGNEESLDAKILNGVEGRNLVSAMTEFITVAVRSTSGEFDGRAQEGADLPFSGLGDSQFTAEMSAVPRARETRSALDTMMLSKVRAHVYNKMPIRLLAFNYTGGNIRLIERDEIFSRILPQVQEYTAAPDFLQKWAEAEAWYNFSNDIIHESGVNKMTALLDEAIKESVHYAILSHTWIRDTPGDVVYGNWNMRQSNQRGLSKVTQFCEVAAREHGITLGWIDTVCINKESSSELDESIRSMHNWYHRAHVCVTYLSETLCLSDEHRDSWFTRGWTLQELVAPTQTHFYNRYWKGLGSSNNAEIKLYIETATTITNTELGLFSSGQIDQIPISRRMQMACGRQVTREEDTAYSLMGIFGVDISVAYGEGSKRAFYRLVRELFHAKERVLDIFNCSYVGSDSGLIPSSPEVFLNRHSFFDKCYRKSGTELDYYTPVKPIILTHLGIRIPLLLVPCMVSTVHKNAIDQGYVPVGNFYGNHKSFVSAQNSTNLYQIHFHNLLDRRLYKKDFDISSLITDGILFNNMCNLAIFNFGVSNSDDVILPQYCAALPLQSRKMWPGNLFVFDGIRILHCDLVVFQFKTAKIQSRIPKNSLEQHGMKLVTYNL